MGQGGGLPGRQALLMRRSSEYAYVGYNGVRVVAALEGTAIRFPRVAKLFIALLGIPRTEGHSIIMRRPAMRPSCTYHLAGGRRGDAKASRSVAVIMEDGGRLEGDIPDRRALILQANIYSDMETVSHSVYWANKYLFASCPLSDS